MNATVGPGLVGDELDRLPVTRLHIFIVLACALGFCFDLAEIAFGSILGTVFSAAPNKIDGGALSWLLSAVYIGAIVGAPLGGWLADRCGRRATMLLTLAVLVATSVAAGLGRGIIVLIVARALSGLALGAYPPLMTAFLADVLPASRRGPLVMGAIALGYVGPPALIFIVRWLTPIEPLGLEAWRWAFLIGGAGALACTLMFWRVPESPRWLASTGRPDKAQINLAAFRRSSIVVPARPLVRPIAAEAPLAGSAVDNYLHRLVFLLVVYFLTPWATVGFSLLSGAVLVGKGINVQDSLLYVGISNFGPIVGTVIGAFFIDRLDRRYALGIAAVAMGVFGIAFAATDSPLLLTGSGLVFNLLTSLFLPVLVLYAAEMFTTPRRAGATSWAWASNRVGSALVPLALLPVLRTAGPVPMFAVIGLTLVAFTAIVLAMGPRGEAGRRLS